MNILELDSYKLSDAVKFNQRLNPKLWGPDEHLRPEVREQLLRIAADFKEFLGIDDIELKDITVSGSNAAYTYTPYSDIDLHLVVDLPKADDSEVYRELFDAKKYQYNEMHNFKIGRYDVELYVENANKSPVSQGIYSVLNNKWIDVPKRRRAEVDDVSTRNKYEDLKHRIDAAVKSGSAEKMTALAKKIKDMRQAGLDQHGEFGPENLAFKMLRKQGKIKQLYDARNAAKDRELSLKEREQAKAPVQYGFRTEDAGETWDGVSPDTDEFAEDAGMTWDGVSPGTHMFIDLPEDSKVDQDEAVLKDFVDFCVKELKINELPTIKLRKDPQWPVVHKTFGRYINDKKLLEVAWGQRHLMDVLRTVAHELTHRHQHERDGSRMGATAGETGSPWENEANARAGVLMRDYGRMHPELFADGQAEDLKEANPNQQLSLYRPDGTTYRGEKMPVLDPNDFHSDTNPRKRVDQVTHQDLANRTAPDLVDPIERTERKIDMDRLKNVIRANMKDLQSTETAVLNMRYWKDLTLEQTAQALGLTPERVRQIEAKALRKLRHLSKSDQLKPFVEPRLTWPGLKEAVGYIPTAAEKNDPRFSMALTQDIRPGQLGKEANKLKLKTDSQGHPQELRPDGLVERMMEELAQFKKKNKLSESEELDEVKMSPSSLHKFAKSPAAKGVRVGFEAEMIVPDVNTGESEPNWEADYDMDERCHSIDEVIQFFRSGEFGPSSRQLDRLRDDLDNRYYEWYDEQMYNAFHEEAEEYIKKVMVDEDDWDEDNEIQKQLDLLELPDSEINEIIKAGESAPKFTSSKEQILYAEQHPLYDKYLDAQRDAEDLLNELVADEVRKQGAYWDAALEDFRHNFTLDDDSSFFDDVGLRWMSDVANEYDVEWPYLVDTNEGNGSADIEQVADSLSEFVKMPVKASYNYHGVARKPGEFIVEPDSSLQSDGPDDAGLEIISPPMPIEEAIAKLKDVIEWAKKTGCYTNSTTGLHMGVSLPGQKSFAEDDGDQAVAEKPIDFMKLALFLGDQHVLKEFGRQANHYCASSIKKLKERRWSPEQIAKAMGQMRDNLIQLAYKDLATSSPGRDSINMKNDYVEFRGAGGDYLGREAKDGIDFLENTMLRYVQALAIAGDPDAYRDEYAKKLYKLISPQGDSTLDLFSKYATGEINKEQLKKDWAQKTLEKDDPSAVAKGNWVVVDKTTGKPVQGQEYNGYTKNEVWERAKQKLSPAASETDFNLRYEVEPQNTGRWEIYRDDQGQEEQLEIIDSPTRGGAVDQAYDKYTGVIPFKVRAYYGTNDIRPEPSRRAKLAKRIIKPKNNPVQDIDTDIAQNFGQSTNPRPTADIANQVRMPNGVPVWELFDLDTGSVVHVIADHTGREAYDQGMSWLRSIGAESPETYGERFAIRPKRLQPGEQNLSEDWRKTLGSLATAGALAAGGTAGLKMSEPAQAPAEPQAVTAPAHTATGLKGLLEKTAQQAGLKGEELAQFMAQCAHETANFTHMKEIGNAKTFARYDPQHSPKKARVLGNVKPGDGARYHGRGFLQLTGRDNYRRAGEALGLPLEQYPELAARPDLAAKIAIWFWKTHVAPRVKNFTDVKSTTQAINPGMKGLKSREQQFKNYQVAQK